MIFSCIEYVAYLPIKKKGYVAIIHFAILSDSWDGLLVSSRVKYMPIPFIRYLVFIVDRILLGFQHETELLEDSLALPGFPPFSCKFGSSEEEYVDSDDLANSRSRTRPPAIQNPPFTDSNLVTVPSGSMKQEFRRRHVPQGWLHKMVL